MTDTDHFRLGDESIPRGVQRDIELAVTESYSGVPVGLPINVWRANAPGPTVFVTAAVHGDELNGTGIVRELILNPPFKLEAGTLVLVPVVNMLGFDRHMRYLPDRRDLNRCFPGSATGSPASRYAAAIFQEIVKNCDYGIDLHTAAVRRTNFPNVRANLRNPEVARIAKAFGCELVINGTGPKGSLRRSATLAKCPTIILEAGEVWKIEPGAVEYGIRGIRNVLIELDMVKAKRKRPAYQALIEKTKWIRADVGGILQFHLAPGDLVEKGQAVATNANLLGKEQNVIHAPCDGIVLGMTTLPSVTPGDPVCHLAIPPGGLGPIRAELGKVSDASLHERLRDDLASNVTVSERPEP